MILHQDETSSTSFVRFEDRFCLVCALEHSMSFTVAQDCFPLCIAPLRSFISRRTCTPHNRGPVQNLILRYCMIRYTLRLLSDQLTVDHAVHIPKSPEDHLV